MLELNNARREDLRKRKEELRAGVENDTAAADDKAQRVLALQEARKQSRLLDEKDEVLRTQLRALKTNQQIGNVVTSEESFALVGLPASVVGRIN